MESPFTDFMGVNGDSSTSTKPSSFQKILKRTDLISCRMLLSSPAVAAHIVPHLTPNQRDVLIKGDEHIEVQAVDEKTGKSYSMKLKKRAHTYYLSGTSDLVKDKGLQPNQVIEFSWRDGVLHISD